jgi:hypothetical protein
MALTRRVGLSTVAMIALSGSACGSMERLEGDAGAVDRRICDGSSSIRLAFAYQVNVARAFPFTGMLYDLGGDFLYVDGTCRYWIQQTSATVDDFVLWRPYREGELTLDQELRLHDAIEYDDIAAGPASSSCKQLGTVDQSAAMLYDGAEVLTCRGSFIVSADWPLRDELYAAATPVTGPVRIQVGLDAINPNAPVYEWPLDVGIDEYSVAEGETRSFRIDDDESIAALRDLRIRAVQDWTRAPGFFSGTIPVAAGGSVREGGLGYVLSLRDDLPFTNSEGVWVPP